MSESKVFSVIFNEDRRSSRIASSHRQRRQQFNRVLTRVGEDGNVVSPLAYFRGSTHSSRDAEFEHQERYDDKSFKFSRNEACSARIMALQYDFKEVPALTDDEDERRDEVTDQLILHNAVHHQIQKRDPLQIFLGPDKNGAHRKNGDFQRKACAHMGVLRRETLGRHCDGVNELREEIKRIVTEPDVVEESSHICTTHAQSTDKLGPDLTSSASRNKSEQTMVVSGKEAQEENADGKECTEQGLFLEALHAMISQACLFVPAEFWDR